MADLWIKRGDKLPRATATLTDADGNPVDLSGASAIFKMREIRGTELLISAAAEIDDVEGGVVGYTWANDDTDVAGGFLGEFAVAFPGGRETFPNNTHILIAIVEDLREVGS